MNKDMSEKWSKEYKKSIDCNNPKGFSQRAHCQGRKKQANEYELEKGSEKKFSPPPHETQTYKNIMSKKSEQKEMTGADSSGSYEAPFKSNSIVKRKINKIPNFTNESLDASSSGSYDVPLFGTTPKGRKDPLKINGPDSVKKSRAVKDKNFPKWGGPGGVFIKIKDKCKKFPYCNQGDINAIEVLKEAINETSKKYGIPIEEMEKIVLNQIKQIFI